MGGSVRARPEDEVLWEMLDLVDVINTYPNSEVQFGDRPQRRDGETRREYVLRVFEYLTTQTQNVRLVVQAMLHDLQATGNEQHRYVDQTDAPSVMNWAWWDDEEELPLGDVDEEEKWWMGDDGADMDEPA